MLVYVLNKNGKPLMPCSPRKARILLKENKAKVIKREPFTIQLFYGSSGYKQKVNLGVDAGSKHIGLSATTEKKELFSGEGNEACEKEGKICRIKEWFHLLNGQEEKDSYWIEYWIECLKHIIIIMSLLLEAELFYLNYSRKMQ